MRTWLVGLVCTATVLAGLSACDDGSSTGEAAGPTSRPPITLPPPPPGITMSFVQQRIWEGTRLADLEVANNTGHPLAVRRVGIDWPGLPGGTQPRVVRVGPGSTLDLHYRLPAPDCTADPETPASGIAVGAHRTVRRPIDETGMRFLTRLWTEACARREVRRLLDVAFVVPRVGGGRTLPAVLRLVRRPGASSPRIELTSVQGTVLFDLATAGATTLDQGARAVRLPVTVDPGRCDEHARSQASQPFTFRFGLLIGDAAVPSSVVVPPDGSGRVRLLAFLDRACAGITQH
ncbi:MAG TPA: hypothetical protein VNS81_11015 [Nocardioides sp.]|nr:hypothetical protein [Nocardioides sp.]